MTVNMRDLAASLELMGKGMLGIFVVMGLIALLVWLVSRTASTSEKKE